MLKNPPMSEKDEEASDEVDSSDDEIDAQAKNSEIESGGESESDQANQSKNRESDSDSDNPEPKSVPESSKAKRSSKQAESEDADVKKSKKTKTDHVGEEVTKKLVSQRLFSEDDEIALLKAILHFTCSEKGDPCSSDQIDSFCEYLKPLISFNATNAQLVTKVRNSKRKYATIVKNALKKGKSEDEIMFSRDLDQTSFELSKKIWGDNGALAFKSRTPKEVKAMIVSPSSRGGEIAYFFKAENVSVLGLDESTVKAGWDVVKDGPKKTAMEEQLKKLKGLQMKLCSQRTGLVAMASELIFK